jgi:hypothetical protein
MSYRIHEIVQAFSIREFLNLCALVDEFGPKKQMVFRHGNGSDVQVVAGQLRERKFNIAKIVRDSNKVSVWVDFGAGVLQWYELGTKAHSAAHSTALKQIA